jgi:copper ion binding protein
METKTLKVTGMSCQMCVKHVTQALEGLDGVSEVKVNLEPGTAVVTFDPAATGMAQFQSAVDEAGYQVTGEA